MTHSAQHAILDSRVIAIVRAPSAERAERTARALLAAGITAIEISLVTPGALDVITALRAFAPPSVAVGVGTALNERHVVDAAAAGAQFVVSPVSDASVIAATKAAGLASIPGAATPSEAMAARRAGADLVKIFPASIWSPGAVKDLLASLPELRVVPTGGISIEAAPAWIEAGAVAVGLGSALSAAAESGGGEDVRRLLVRLDGAAGAGHGRRPH